MNLSGRAGIESCKQAVERAGAAGFAGRQPVAQILIARGAFEQAVQQSAQIKTGAAGHDRQLAARGNPGDGLAGQARIFAGGEQFVGIDDIDQVVGNTTARRRPAAWRFRYRNGGRPAASRS